MKYLHIRFFIFIFFIINNSYALLAQDTIKIKTLYFDDGVIALEKLYGNNNKLTRVKAYYPSGKISEILNYRDNILDGKYYKYHKNGEKQATWEFKFGKLISVDNHFKPYNKKTKERTLLYYKQLNAINEKMKSSTVNISYYFRRGDLLHRLGFHTLALSNLKQIERFLKKSKKINEVPRRFLGNLYDCMASVYSHFELENHAIHYRYLAVEVNPSQTRLVYNLGDYLASIKSYKLALHYLNKTKKVWPKHAFTHQNLALINLNQGNYKKALEHIEIAFNGENQLIKLGSLTEEKGLRSVRGYIKHKLGNSNAGKKDLKHALKLNPNNSYALRNLGIICHDLGEYDTACELLTKSKELGFEKTHDGYSLQKYIDISCSKENKHHPVKLINETKTPSITIDDGLPKAKRDLLNISKKLILYPNPATEIITIENVLFKNFEYQIVNYNSKLIQSGKAVNSSIDITKLTQGFYIINITNNGKSQALRFIKE